MDKAIGTLVFSLLIFAKGLAAQTSTTLVKNDPAQQYTVIEAALQQMYDHLPLSNISRGFGEYNLATCVDVTNYLGSSKNSDPAAAKFADLLSTADRVLGWENDFRKLGIPQEIWGTE